MIYIIHFDQKYKHAQHYIGFSDDPVKRSVRHKKSNGSKLLRAVKKAGISFRVVRIIEGDRHAERKLKNQNNSRRFCPVCNPGGVR